MNEPDGTTRGPTVSGSRAGDVLATLAAMVGLVVAVANDPVDSVALAVLATVLIAWPFGFLVFLARRWARIGDVRYVGVTLVLAITAVASAGAGIMLAG